MARPLPHRHDDLYERDFHAWTQAQAEALRMRRFDRIDLENIVEELETLGRSERHAIRNRLGVLLMHLLKWAWQPEKRSSGWRGTILEQRRQLRRLLDENPSLHSLPASALADEHDVARLKAAGDTGLPEAVFPTSCPFTIDEILNEDFWPELGGKRGLPPE